MAGTTGFSVFHIFHGRPVGTALRLEQIRMAFVATEHVDVSRVRENHIAVILVLVENIAGMTAGTVAGHPKGSITIMAGAARLAFGHRIHGGMVAIVTRFEEIGMALSTAKHVDMNFVTEFGNTDTLGLDCNIAGVTGGTVTSNTESLAPVVARPAGPAPLHQFHGHMVAVILLFENSRMAYITFESMQTVAEDNCSDTLGLDGEFVYHAPDTTHASHSPHAYSVKNGHRRTNQQQSNY